MGKKTITKILFKNSKFHNVIYALIYVIIYDYMWKNFESVYFSFAGIIYVDDFNHRLVGYLFALYPILFFRGLRNASSWVSIILYYVGYIPMIMGLCLDMPLDSKVNINSYYITLSLAMSMFFLADYSKISFKRKTGKKISPKWLWAITIIFTILLLVTYGGNMRLSNFTDIYILREENSTKELSGIGYVYSWCANFFYPFVFCMGLLKNNKKFIILGIMCFVLLFSIMGQKSDILAPLILWALYKVVIWVDKNKTNIMAPITLGILAITIFLFRFVESETVFGIAGLFFNRTLGVSAYHVPMYLDFFADHPYTYFSHINIVNAITHSYPYPESLGRMISPEENGVSNAIFWLMDGVASCGALGIVIISVIVYYFLLMINGICNEKNKFFIYTMMLIPMVAMVNVSFFTTVLSKGILFLFLTVWFVDISIERYGPVVNNVSKVYSRSRIME